MGSVTHSEAPQVSVQLGLKSRSSESFVNRPKTVRGSILVPLGIAPDSDREHQGETFLGQSTPEVQAECGVDGTGHGLNPLGPSYPRIVLQGHKNVCSTQVCQRDRPDGLQGHVTRNVDVPTSRASRQGSAQDSTHWRLEAENGQVESLRGE